MKKQTTLLALAFASLFAFSSALVQADDGHKHEKKETAKADKTYPLDTCVVSGDKLDHEGKPYLFKHEGQEVKLCCKDCLADFKKDPAKYTKKIEDARKSKQ
jgi:YHS domain-containing protein